MTQTYQPRDRVIVLLGADAGRSATVVANYRSVYGDDLVDGALVQFADNKPTNEPGQTGVEREFPSFNLRLA